MVYQDPTEPDITITNGFPVREQLFLLSLILILIFGTAYAPKFLATLSNGGAEPVEQTDPVLTLPEPVNKSIIKPLSGVEVNAKAAFVWDVAEQRILYSKDSDMVLPLASITKLMTALVAYELVDGGEPVAISLEAIKQEGSSGFADGEQFSMKTLSDLTLMSSSNDGAFALAAAAGSLLSDDPDRGTSAFIEAMNIRAGELGLTHTTFFNPTGLDLSTTQSGSYSTARETTFLMEYILEHYPDILSATQEGSAVMYNETGSLHEAENTNVIVSDIPNLIGSKTGFTDLAGGNLVVAYDAGLNRPIIVTVLGSTRNGRFEDVKALVAAVAASTEGVTE